MIDGRDLRDRAVRGPRRGRPRLFDGPSERVSIRIPARVYDAIDGTARRLDASVPDVIRQLLERQFRR